MKSYKQVRKSLVKKISSKNAKLLKEFTAYCEKYPGERFWQCIRNWSGAYSILFHKFVNEDDGRVIFDTFYWDNKDKV